MLRGILPFFLLHNPWPTIGVTSHLTVGFHDLFQVSSLPVLSSPRTLLTLSLKPELSILLFRSGLVLCSELPTAPLSGPGLHPLKLEMSSELYGPDWAGSCCSSSPLSFTSLQSPGSSPRLAASLLSSSLLLLSETCALWEMALKFFSSLGKLFST